MIEFVRKNFGNKMHPFSQYEWQPGDPEGLRNFDHLGDAVFFGRYEGADTIDPEFANLTSGMIVNDPGGRFIGVSYVVGSRMVIVHAPHLSGEMSVEKKLVKKWQREMDKLINHASEGKYEYDLAMHCWRIASEEHELERYRAMKTAEKTYHQSRRDCSTPEIDKLKERISKSTSRMLKSRNRAHQAISDFVTAFSHIVWPSFGKDQKMFKKKVGALPGWWRNKLMMLAHQRLRKKIVQKAANKGKTCVDVCEACSTRLCPSCGHMESQGMYIFYNHVLISMIKENR